VDNIEPEEQADLQIDPSVQEEQPSNSTLQPTAAADDDVLPLNQSTSSSKLNISIGPETEPAKEIPFSTLNF